MNVRMRSRKLTYLSFLRKQREIGVAEMQRLINTGEVWCMEGAVSKRASELLACGACILPTKANVDYWGNFIPSRYMVEQGTAGSWQNAVKYYTKRPVVELC